MPIRYFTTMILLLTCCSTDQFFNQMLDMCDALLVFAKNINEIKDNVRIENRGRKIVIPVLLDYREDHERTKIIFKHLPPIDHIVKNYVPDDNDENDIASILKQEFKIFSKNVEVQTPKALAEEVQKAGRNRVLFSITPTTASTSVSKRAFSFARASSFRIKKVKPIEPPEPLGEKAITMLNELSTLMWQLHREHTIAADNSEINKKREIENVNSTVEVSSARKQSIETCIQNYKEDRIKKPVAHQQIKEVKEEELKSRRNEIDERHRESERKKYKAMVEKQIETLREFKHKNGCYMNFQCT